MNQVISNNYSIIRHRWLWSADILTTVFQTLNTIPKSSSIEILQSLMNTLFTLYLIKAEINSFSFMPFERCQQWKMSFQMKTVSADWITIHYWCCFSCTQLSVCHNWDITPWLCPWWGYTWADTANDEEQIVMIVSTRQNCYFSKCPFLSYLTR